MQKKSKKCVKNRHFFNLKVIMFLKSNKIADKNPTRQIVKKTES